ncbi:MAG TPA: DUF2141 domain-containing protein [Allosphingosinicella sp.]|jgi:uncharacterized protein (DUF2141 family)
MSKLLLAAAAATGLVATAAPAQAALGPDAASCRPGSTQPAVLVNVSGFKSRSGRVRVQIYNSSNFLVKGQRVRRIDLPVTSSTMPICVALPGPSTYAVAVRHDFDGDNKSGDWSDGGGFSRNPKLSLLKLKPSFGQVAIPVGNGVRPVHVVLNYRQGLSIGPVAKS